MVETDIKADLAWRLLKIQTLFIIKSVITLLLLYMFYLRSKLQNRENYPQGTIDSLWKGNLFHRKGCTSLIKNKTQNKRKELKQRCSINGRQGLTILLFEITQISHAPYKTYKIFCQCSILKCVQNIKGITGIFIFSSN